MKWLILDTVMINMNNVLSIDFDDNKYMITFQLNSFDCSLKVKQLSYKSYECFEIDSKKIKNFVLENNNLN